MSAQDYPKITILGSIDEFLFAKEKSRLKKLISSNILLFKNKKRFNEMLNFIVDVF